MSLNHKLVGKTLSVVLLLNAAALFLSAGVGLLYAERIEARMFLIVGLSSGIFGLLGLNGFHPVSKTMRVRDAFASVTFSWLLLSLIGALPFWMSGAIPDYAGAFFESASGFTTTGSTVIADVESLPCSVLFWRSFIQWLGGMGILAFATAILPSFGIGAGALANAESTGITKDKIYAKQADASRVLYLLYIGFTALETILLMLGGMSGFDALNHSLTTMATGGFSTRNISAAAFNPFCQWVMTVFMMLAGIRFPLYLDLIRKRFRAVKEDAEWPVFLSIWLGCSFLFFVILLGSHLYDGTYATQDVFMCVGSGFANSSSALSAGIASDVVLNAGDLFRISAFQVASLLTTTGFGIADYELWPSSLRMLCFLLLFAGGCAGSTAGGVKTVRLMVFFKTAKRGLYLRLHPKAVVPLKVGKRTLTEETVASVSTFFFVYFALFLFGGLILSFADISPLSAFSSALTALSNVGPGLEAVGPTCTFAFFPGWAKIFLGLYMLIGRLEIFTVLTLFMPAFWNPNRY